MQFKLDYYDYKDGEYKDQTFEDVDGYEFIDNFLIIICADGSRHAIRTENVQNFSLIEQQENI